MVAPLVLLYFAVLLLLCTLGAHRAHLVYQCIKHRKRLSGVELDALPFVTVQLPLYNEATVVGRLLDAVAKLDYPRDRFEVQVLDDSNDETRVLARAKVQELRNQGIDAHYVQRPDRVGYKAGALDFGLGTAR